MADNELARRLTELTERTEELIAVFDIREKVAELEGRVRERQKGATIQNLRDARAAFNAVVNDMHDLGLTGLGEGGDDE